MDYQQFGSRVTAVPNLYRNSGVLRYGGGRKRKRDEAPGGRRHQDLRVRPCLTGTDVNEFKFETESFNVIEVVKQINDNFITAVVLGQAKKVLVLMDQHAIHERICYENLLRDYTMQDRKHFLSIGLDVPILINDFSKQCCKWLLEHSREVERFGIKFKSERPCRLIITSIPKCFNRIKLNQGAVKLELIVRKLLTQLTNGLDYDYTPHTNVPMVIHHAIATEACHGAIKFGERLTVDQCTKLVKSLMHTTAPSRCAHGRPSVIPLLELKGPDNCQIQVSQKKLNFASLKRNTTKSRINIVNNKNCNSIKQPADP